MKNNYKRGSEWRKWDLHVHTPMSDGYKGTWEQFKNQLLKSECAVVGINDYCSVEGYKRIKDEIDNNTLRLNDLKLLPIVEMRMTDSVQNKNTATNGVTHFNFHIIFNDSMNVEDIENFIKSLKCEGTKIGSDYSDKKKIKTKKVSFFDTLNELNSDSKFKDNFLIWLPYDEYGGIDEIDPNSDGWIKKNFINNSHILGSSNQKQIDFFHWKNTKFTESQYKDWFGVKKPCIKGSDSHNYDYPIGKLRNNKSEPIEKYCWIKADPTFEGLKQIICEPEDRVLIQPNKPEEKSGYQVIDSIEIHNEYCNQKIKFNPNLNTIIGGRSTGKSTLLKVLVNKINSELLKNDDNFDNFEKFINKLSFNATVLWKDNEESTNRDIDFFPQSYMYRIANDEVRKNRLVEDIIKEKDQHNNLLKYESFCDANKFKIQKKVDEIFEFIKKQKNISKSLKEKGDIDGVTKEVDRIKNKIDEIKLDESFGNKEQIQFKTDQDLITQNKIAIEKYQNDINKIEELRQAELIDQSVSYKINSISSKNQKPINELFEEIKQEFTKKWDDNLFKQINLIKQQITDKKLLNTKIEESDSYKLGKKHLDGNIQFKEFSKKLAEEQSKLDKIKDIQKELSYINKKINNLKKEILDLHLKFKVRAEDLKSKINQSFDDIAIDLSELFKKDICKELLSDSINLKSYSRQNYVENFVNEYHSKTKNTVKKFIDKMINQEIELKGVQDHQTLSKRVLTENWFSISYNMTYQNDTFDLMSDGKKAFVILKLLLAVSEKKSPILIDQPEDSLDNRAIYNELVKYIKNKKKERQIILVTHNANVVVNADAEEVIVANQHGEDSKNTNNIKFEYVSGSLENTFPKNESIPTVLHSQGIREHVCEILEGGTEAFKKREDKYGIK